MNYYVVEDSELAKRNKSLIGACGSGWIEYNAVISAVFSAESTTEPITLQEAKDWCRVDITDDDALITLLITAARQVCEYHSNLSLINRTVTARIMNGLGGQQLPYGPVIAISAATDYNGTDIFTNFTLDDAYGNYITVTYTAGYTTLPQHLRHAILNQIAWMYEQRGDDTVKGSMSEFAKLLLNQVRSV